MTGLGLGFLGLDSICQEDPIPLGSRNGGHKVPQKTSKNYSVCFKGQQFAPGAGQQCDSSGCVGTLAGNFPNATSRIIINLPSLILHFCTFLNLYGQNFADNLTDFASE